MYCFVSLWRRDGCLNFIDENDEVLISGFGRRGHAVPPSGCKLIAEAFVHLYHFGKAIYWESRSEGRMEKAQAVLFVRSVISPVSDSRSSRRLYIYFHDIFLKVQSVTLSFLTLCFISHESYLSNL